METLHVCLSKVANDTIIRVCFLTGIGLEWQFLKCQYRYTFPATFSHGRIFKSEYSVQQHFDHWSSAVIRSAFCVPNTDCILWDRMRLLAVPWLFQCDSMKGADQSLIAWWTPRIDIVTQHCFVTMRVRDICNKAMLSPALSY